MAFDDALRGFPMLNVYFGDMPEEIYNTSLYFDNTYQNRWITDPVSVEIIRDVDRSDVVSASLIESPVLGPITPKMLSHGVKTLLLVRHDKKHVFNISTCGDNCAKWLLKIADGRKVTVSLHHVMNFGKDGFKIKIVNSGKIVTNMKEFLHEAIELL